VDREVFSVDVTLIGPVEVGTGGDAVNEAFTASRLGNRVGLVTKVGDDVFGRLLLEDARKAGVATDQVKVSPTDRTAVAALLVGREGNRNICAYRGAFENLRLDDLDLEAFGRAKIVNVGSMFALRSLDGEGVRTVLERAKSSGALTGADMKFDTYGLGFEGIKAVFPFLDYFMPSYDEALYLTGEREPDGQCRALMAAGCGNVVVKLGPEGCYLATPSKRERVPPCLAERVDTSGAGDNFVAGFLTGLNRGWDAERCARFGNATAAVSIQEVGSNGAVRSYGQVVDHMRRVGYSWEGEVS
jgi:2-dehydro-3-deoxygluconokinase